MKLSKPFKDTSIFHGYLEFLLPDGRSVMVEDKGLDIKHIHIKELEDDCFKMVGHIRTKRKTPKDIWIAFTKEEAQVSQ